MPNFSVVNLNAKLYGVLVRNVDFAVIGCKCLTSTVVFLAPYGFSSSIRSLLK